MKEGDVALALLPQADGGSKNRPVILLRKLPGFGDFLVCGLSTQMHQQIAGFDDVISQTDSDFTMSGLKESSIIRLTFLIALPQKQFLGRIGSINPDRHQRLLQRLGSYLLQ